ncbi:cyclic GMP-AMP synthase-like receptor [Aphomia sociella]
MDNILHDINRKYVRIKKREKTYNNTIVRAVLQEVLEKMRAHDPLFNSMKPRLAYLGSYYDGLRVGHATEFDINIVLKLPINYKKIKLDATEMENAYTSVIMPSEFRRLCLNPLTADKGFKETEYWCDKSYRLSVKKFLSWVQSVVDTALSRFPKDNDKYLITINNKVYKIISKLSGPANTITLIDNDVVIDIDLVPTFAFEYPKVPNNSQVYFSDEVFQKIRQYFIVPKPTDDEYGWRLAFPYQELFIMTGKNNLKSVVKLIKLLRDVQGFYKLSSYYIKTVFLWEVSRKPVTFWEKPLSYLVIYMLKELRDQLKIRTVDNYWSPDHNLLEMIKYETCQNWCNRLTVIINEIEKHKQENPSIVKQFFIKH